MVYLDYAANCPVDKEVLDLFYDTTVKYYANPNSSHKLGLEAKNKLDQSTENIARNLHVLKDEIIYTSGATEANNLAIKGVCESYKAYGKHIIISTLEHNSITSSSVTMQEKGFEVEVLPVQKDGKVDVEALKQMIRKDTILVSVCAVDSELGIKQPIEEIGKLLKNYPNVIFHSDASQSIGKVPISFEDTDLVTVAPHKFYGMNGFGMLIKKKNIRLKPQIDGGKSVTIFRSGTPVLASVVALDKALDKALKNQEERLNYVYELNREVINFLSSYDKVTINSTKESIPYTINFSIDGIKSMEFAKKLEEYDIYISTKTSCCPTFTPSKLVYAVTHDKSLAATSLRLSLSHQTTKEELNEFYKVFDLCYKEVK